VLVDRERDVSHAQARVAALPRVPPNRGHEVIAAMEERFERVWVLTQNVDGLHRKLFGTHTAGASARKETYTLTNGLYQVTFPVKAYTGFLDRPIERRGLEPDVPVNCNAKDLAVGKDTVLEAAKAYLQTENK